jgi:uncharacterized RDD family membrane protein YckC
VTGAPPDAPLARRFAALAYEATLYSALVLLAGVLTIPLSSSAPSGAGGVRIPDLPARVLSFTLVFAAGALYYGWFWTGGRRTLPMKTWRLRITRSDGAPPEVRTALVRYVAAWIGPSLALFAYVALRCPVSARTRPGCSLSTICGRSSIPIAGFSMTASPAR